MRLKEQREPMNRIWSDRVFWRRVGIVLAGLWAAIVTTISISNPRNFGWVTYDQLRNGNPIDGLGPGALLLIVGLAAIVAICAGIPWVASSLSRPDRPDNPQGPLP